MPKASKQKVPPTEWRFWKASNRKEQTKSATHRMQFFGKLAMCQVGSARWWRLPGAEGDAKS
jgi:hypothetical protein